MLLLVLSFLPFDLREHEANQRTVEAAARVSMNIFHKGRILTRVQSFPINRLQFGFVAPTSRVRIVDDLLDPRRASARAA
jgi:hypothetical protein